jgi:chromosome segregation ATPase
MKLSRLIRAMTVCLAVSALAPALGAQAMAQEPGARPRPARPATRANEDAGVKPDAAPPVATSEEATRNAISLLTEQITALNAELKKLRLETRRNSETMQLLLYEERLARIEEKVEEAMDHKAQLDAREQELQRRMRNIQQEVMLRGGLRRDEAEAALRAEFQRALEDVRNQQSTYQQRIAELQAQATRMRARVEALRKKLEPSDEKQ